MYRWCILIYAYASNKFCFININVSNHLWFYARLNLINRCWINCIICNNILVLLWCEFSYFDLFIHSYLQFVKHKIVITDWKSARKKLSLGENYKLNFFSSHPQKFHCHKSNEWRTNYFWSPKFTTGFFFIKVLCAE